MQNITLIPVGGLVPEIISEADFYSALNRLGSVNNVERLITIRERRYYLITLNVSSTGSGASGYLFRQVFIPGAKGQTEFTLFQAPSLGVQVLLTVNGHVQEVGVDYAITGTVLTWLNSDFQLSTADRIIIYFS